MHTPLPRSTPEVQGLSSQAVLTWLDAMQADQLELHSFMLLRAGQVLAEGGGGHLTVRRGLTC